MSFCFLFSIYNIYHIKISPKNEPRHEKSNVLHICENKDADQLRGNREADQRLCFRYIDSTIHLLSIPEIYPSSVAVQPGLCRTMSQTRTLVFSQCGSNDLSSCTVVNFCI